MKQLLVNGIEESLPQAACYGQVLEHVLKTHVSDNAWISSVLIDGQELRNWDEPGVRTLPLANVTSVDFRLIHPSSLANETLETLMLFTDAITVASRRVSEAIRKKENPALEYQKLLDDLETFNASFTGAKDLISPHLPGGQIPSDVQFVEADFLSILQETLNYARQGQYDYMGEMLETHLPENMAEWRDSALPRLIARKN